MKFSRQLLIGVAVLALACLCVPTTVRADTSDDLPAWAKDLPKDRDIWFRGGSKADRFDGLEKCVDQPTPGLATDKRVLIIDEGLFAEDLSRHARAIVEHWEQGEESDLVLAIVDEETGEVGLSAGRKWKPHGENVDVLDLKAWLNWSNPEARRKLATYTCQLLDGTAKKVVRNYFRNELDPADLPMDQTALIHLARRKHWNFEGIIDSVADGMDMNAPGLAAFEQKVGRAHLLYADSRTLAYAGDLDAARAHLDEADDLADEARATISDYRKSLQDVEDLTGPLERLEKRLDETSQLFSGDEADLRSSIQACRDKYDTLVREAPKSLVPADTPARIEEVRDCISTADSAVDKAVDDFRLYVFGLPIVAVVFLGCGGGVVLFRRYQRASKLHMPMWEAIAKWHERKPELEARLETIRSRLRRADGQRPANLGEFDEWHGNAEDIATAFALFAVLDRRYAEAEKTVEAAGPFQASALEQVRDMLKREDIRLSEGEIGELSPVRVELDEPLCIQASAAIHELAERTKFVADETQLD